MANKSLYEDAKLKMYISYLTPTIIYRIEAIADKRNTSHYSEQPE